MRQDDVAENSGRIGTTGSGTHLSTWHEPFGALDAKVRKELRRWLRRLHDELHITGIIVTHDQEEALEVADRVVVMHQGNVEQIGTPDEVYENPVTPFVYQFLGDVNVFHGRAIQERTIANLQPLPEVDSVLPAGAVDEREVTFVRPHDLELNRYRTNSEQFEATVRYILTAGSRVRVELVALESEQTIEVELTKERYRDLAIREGEVVFVHPRHRQVFKIPQS